MAIVGLGLKILLRFLTLCPLSLSLCVCVSLCLNFSFRGTPVMLSSRHTLLWSDLMLSNHTYTDAVSK